MSEEHPPVHVGDHVIDRDADDAPLLVVGRPADEAAEYRVDGVPLSEYNPSYPGDDSVIEAVYPQRSDIALDTEQTYAFPRSRLRIDAPIHDIDIETGRPAADD